MRNQYAGGRGKSKFAHKLGISASTYNYYENNRIPPIEILLRICEVTGANLQWLLTGRETAGENESEKQKPETVPKSAENRQSGAGSTGLATKTGGTIGTDRNSVSGPISTSGAISTSGPISASGAINASGQENITEIHSTSGVQSASGAEITPDAKSISGASTNDQRQSFLPSGDN